MRRIPILNILPSTTPGIPSSIEVSSNMTSLFHGKEWINDAVSPAVRYPFYTYDNDTNTSTPAPPYGTRLLTATSFEIVENSKYAGKYTTYTQTTSGSLASTTFSNSKTVIRVNESISPIGNSSTSLLTSGFITNISTYKFTVTGEADLTVLEGAINSVKGFELVGKNYSGWGEILQQNFLKDVQNFAGSTAPINPLQGQLWFDTANLALKIMPTSGGTWTTLGTGTSTSAPAPAPAPSPSPVASTAQTLICELKTGSVASVGNQFIWQTSTILPSDDCSYNDNTSKFQFATTGLYEITVVGETFAANPYGGATPWDTGTSTVNLTLNFSGSDVIPRSTENSVSRGITKEGDGSPWNAGISQSFFLNVTSVAGNAAVFSISAAVQSYSSISKFKSSLAVSVKRISAPVTL